MMNLESKLDRNEKNILNLESKLDIMEKTFPIWNPN